MQPAVRDPDQVHHQEINERDFYSRVQTDSQYLPSNY